MLNIGVIAKLGSVTHRVKPEDKFGDKKKARPKGIT